MFMALISVMTFVVVSFIVVVGCDVVVVGDGTVERVVVNTGARVVGMVIIVVVGGVDSKVVGVELIYKANKLVYFCVNLQVYIFIGH